MKGVNKTMSCILCIIDGMTDPMFCAADYKGLSAMRQLQPVCTVPPGCSPESLTCILTILGVKPIPAFIRGYAEALGEGIPVCPDDLILRASWAAVEHGRCSRLISAPPEIETRGEFRYYALGGYKSLLILPSLAGCVKEIETHPFYLNADTPAKKLRPSGNALLSDIFDRQCSNERCMVPWGQSRPVEIPSFPSRGAVICGTSVVKGIAHMLQMMLWNVPGATGDVDTNLSMKYEAAIDAAKEFPFVLLHINGADEAAHRRNAVEKKEFLMKVDRMITQPLLHCGHKVCVMADHETDPATGLHSGIYQPRFSSSAGDPILNSLLKDSMGDWCV